MQKKRKTTTQLPFLEFLGKVGQASKRKGTEKISDEEIQAEIRAGRREKTPERAFRPSRAMSQSIVGLLASQRKKCHFTDPLLGIGRLGD